MASTVAAASVAIFASFKSGGVVSQVAIGATALLASRMQSASDLDAARTPQRAQLLANAVQ